MPLLNEDMLARVEMYVSIDGESVCVPRLPSPLTHDDIKRLQWWTKGTEAYLNDNIINSYLKLICERSRVQDGWPSVHAMDTFFLLALFKDGKYNYDHVRRWTKNTDIFQFDLILVPIQLPAHWSMAIIDMRTKTITYYDSLGGYNDAVPSILIQYLKDEHLDKKNLEYNTIMRKKSVRRTTIPQQENGHDCGVFACMYAEYITRNETIDRKLFSQNDMEYFRKKMAYELCVKHELLAPNREKMIPNGTSSNHECVQIMLNYAQYFSNLIIIKRLRLDYYYYD